MSYDAQPLPESGALTGYNAFRFARPIRPRFLKVGRRFVRAVLRVHVLKSTRQPGPALLIEFADDEGEIRLAPLNRFHVQYNHQEPELVAFAAMCRAIYAERPPRPLPLTDSTDVTEPASRSTALAQLRAECEARCRASKGGAAPCGLAGCEATKWGGCPRYRRAVNDGRADASSLRDSAESQPSP